MDVVALSGAGRDPALHRTRATHALTEIPESAIVFTGRFALRFDGADVVAGADALVDANVDGAAGDGGESASLAPGAGSTDWDDDGGSEDSASRFGASIGAASRVEAAFAASASGGDGASCAASASARAASDAPTR